MNVAFLIHSMRVGGAERSIARLVNALDHSRFSPLVICMTVSGPAADWIESSDVPVIEIDKRGGVDRGAQRRLTKILSDYRVDILHSHNWGTLVESVLARRQSKVPVHVHAERGSVLAAAELRGIRMRMRGHVAGWAMRRCDAVVTNARSVAKRIEQRCGYPADQVDVIPNGVSAPSLIIDAAEIENRRRQLGIAKTTLVLGSVGRLVSVKGFDVLIRAVESLVNQGRDVRLLLAGDGPERDALQRLAHSCGLNEKIHFVGHQTDLRPWYSMFDLYINSSHSEGLSQSLVEAMAAGCPVIATDVGDSREVIDPEQTCGLLVAPGSWEAIAAAVRMLDSPERLKNAGLIAAKRQKKFFSLESMSTRYMELYSRLLSEPARNNGTSGGGVS